jgi:aryl-alcohol dehydrogenase-like predicted oxidoreductase
LDDTAEAYGDGRSEELVGAIVLRRPDTMVFTKVAHFASGARAQDVNRAIRGSLRRLRRDHVDLYQIHWPSEHHVPIEETWARDGATNRTKDSRGSSAWRTSTGR